MPLPVRRKSLRLVLMDYFVRRMEGLPGPTWTCLEDVSTTSAWRFVTRPQTEMSLMCLHRLRVQWDRMTTRCHTSGDEASLADRLLRYINCLRTWIPSSPGTIGLLPLRLTIQTSSTSVQSTRIKV